MSWLIEAESIDRNVLDDAGGYEKSGSFEQNLVNEGVELHDDDEIEILPPVDNITFNNYVEYSHNIVQDTSIFTIGDDQESIHSGMTIIPSCASSSVTAHHQQIVQYSSAVVSVLDESDVALSINPNSLDSSILTEMSASHLISSVNSCESDEQERDEDTKMACYTDSNDSIVSATSVCNTHDGQNRTCWYGHFESEQDWDKFREKNKQLLEAVDCPIDERDELLAQLINLEEKMFWDSNDAATNDTAVLTPSKSSWMLEVLALSATIAVTGVVIIKLLKSR